jgi:hypothetical protein
VAAASGALKLELKQWQILLSTGIDLLSKKKLLPHYPRLERAISIFKFALVPLPAENILWIKQP